MSANTPGRAFAAAQGDRPQFFARSALVMAGIVLISFPLTYFLPVATGSRRFQLLYHVHGLALFGWIALYVWQTRLVAQGRVARHREIGLAGFALTGTVVVLGFWMAQRPHRTASARWRILMSLPGSIWSI